MARTLSTRNLFDRKFKTFEFEGVWFDVLGNPETTGAWIVYGNEKNGKTWFSLKLAEYLSSFAKTLYVSAEEGTDLTFVKACERARLDPNNRNIQFLEYESIEDLNIRLKKRKSAKIVIIDNVTIYKDELKNGEFRRMLRIHKDKLLIFIAHEDKGEPDGATGKLIKKLAKIIMRIQGLTCFISGRCPGGILQIDEEKSKLYGSVT